VADTPPREPPPAPDPAGWPAGLRRYRPVELLGSGGMSRVFRAWDPPLRRFVAVKLLRSEDPDLARRFLREAQAQARVEHPNVCKVFEVGEADGHPFIAMQLIEGQSLGEAVAARPLEQKVLLVKQVAEAVQAAHSLGLIHRDLKPGNVMVETTADGRLHPYVVDFGLVRELGAEPLTLAGETMGTPSFMAPEQATGDAARIDRRTDVYGLGATLYALIAGQPPFAGTVPLDILRKVVNEEPTPLRQRVPSLPADLRAIVMKCLEKEPARRYDSARALAEDLGRFLDGRPVLARPTGSLYRLVKLARRHRALVAVAAAALVAISLTGGMWLHARRASARQAVLAQRFGQQVEQIESILWRAQSLEVHDIRPTREVLAKALADIERDMVRLGSIAAGPGHSALGRGYLALQDVATARTHLEAAWAAGYRNPEVAFALGSVMGLLYQRELAGLATVTDRSQRERRRREAERTYRDPALQYLRASSGSALVAPELLRALLAFYEARTDEALAGARAAFSRVPWLYQAKVLEGETHRMIGSAHEEAGRYASAVAAYQAADVALREAARIGRSAPAVHEALCRVWSNILYLEVWALGQASESHYATAVRACTDAATVDPDNAVTMTRLAAVHNTWAELAVGQGGDPSAAVTAAIAAARAAVGKAPDNVAARSQLAIAFWERGKHEMARGADPRPSFLEGRGHLEQALRLDPRDSHALTSLGLLLLDQGVWEDERRLDPTATLERSADAFRRAWDLEPQSANAGANLAMAYEVLLLHQVANDDGDPDATAATALDILDRARQLNPKLFYTLRTIGSVLTALGELERQRGRDPTPQLDQAQAALQAALDTNPNDAATHLAVAEAHMVAARFAVAQGRTPTVHLAAVRRALARVAAGSPDQPAVVRLRREAAALDRRGAQGRHDGPPGSHGMMVGPGPARPAGAEVVG